MLIRLTDYNNYSKEHVVNMGISECMFVYIYIYRHIYIC